MSKDRDRQLRLRNLKRKRQTIDRQIAFLERKLAGAVRNGTRAGTSK